MVEKELSYPDFKPLEVSMKLNSLIIRKDYTGDTYHCTVSIINEHGNIELKLSPEQTQRMVNVVADELYQSATQTADMLKNSMVEMNRAIEHQPDDDEIPF